MADVLVLRGAEALRTVSFHNNDRKRFRRRTLSEMAEPGLAALAGGTSLPVAPPTNKFDDTLTDSEVALTPEDASSGVGSSGSDNGGGNGGAGQQEHQDAGVAVADTPTLDPTTTTTTTTTTKASGAGSDTPTTTASKSPRYDLSRHASFSGSSSYQEDWDIPPLDRLTVLDLLDNFALPQQLEKLSKGISAQTRKLRNKSRDALKSRSRGARVRMVEEWRHRVPSAEEQLDRYRARMRASVETLGRQWNDTKVITMREKVAFICGVLNIFVSGYLIGGYPQYMHLWYTAQILYFMPIRFYTYHRRGYHYFLADLCYFVNLLLVLSLWVFPHSRRLFVATYCLAFGNNAVAIVMWRNSLVFHSFDKVTSLFIHVMPCATLHCLVHLVDPALQQQRFPAVYAIQHRAAGSSYDNVASMLAWSSIPYAVWQLTYYFFITVRRREKIAAGRPTSFTWLRRSYSKTWIGRLVLALPDVLQEPAFMLIQYSYAVLTMLPCPIWFRYRWAGSAFLMFVFTWSIYNGATYYIDVFGTRFQKELEAMKQEVAKWHSAESLAGSGGGGGGGGDNVSTGGDGNGNGDDLAAVANPHDLVESAPPELETSSEVGEHEKNGGGSGRHGGVDGASPSVVPLLDEALEEAVLHSDNGDGEDDDDIDDDNSNSSSIISGKGGGDDTSKREPVADPGAASAAAAMATATMTGTDWDMGAKEVARRRL
ncbi:hypothetical protein SPI_03198 [Niveomyces insectorum RCEF 264]|uniref:Glycerophosphocholine acyltransferase 1 n=1 Tax=Niveomyces insectorum RCEF 264 TaxID=1081102 RepID=A0A167X5G5_9HYPO|nr:hypothetical protein SPI_03198 [Niveomyces insectorum RCEF 264]